MSDHPAISNLRQFQRQLDNDGIEVGVSRQALEEVLALLTGAAEPPADWTPAPPTPGPYAMISYEVCGSSDGHRYGERGYVVRQVRGRELARFPFSQESRELARDVQGEQRANAALYVAAPVLRDALRGVLGLLTMIGGRDDVTDGLRVAITTNHRVKAAAEALALAGDFQPSEEAENA